MFTTLLGLSYFRSKSLYEAIYSRDFSQNAARFVDLPDISYGPYLLPAMLHTIPIGQHVTSDLLVPATSIIVAIPCTFRETLHAPPVELL